MTAIAIIGGVLIIILIIFTVYVVKNIVKESIAAKPAEPERAVPGAHIKDFKNIVEPEREEYFEEEKEAITVGAGFLNFAEDKKKNRDEDFEDSLYDDEFDFEYDYKTRSIDEDDEINHIGRYSKTDEEIFGGRGNISVTLKYNDGEARKVLKMVTSQITVGRGIGNDLLLNGHSFISKNHAIFSLRGNKLYLKDLDSRNGTSVNGKRIRGEVLLRESCEVAFGKVKVRVIITEDN